MNKRRNIIRIVTTGLLAVTITAFTPQTLHRHDFDHALFLYRQNPSPASEQLIRAEQAKNGRVLLGIMTIEALVIFAVLNGLWLAAGRALSHNGPSANAT